MDLPRSFPAEDAEATIQRTGVYTLEDHVVGNRIEEFSDLRFPIKSPLGLEFIAQNSFVRKDIRRVLDSTLGRPHLGLIKIYNQILPSDYVFRLHNGSVGEAFCLLVLLWSPGSIVCFYDGSISQNIEDDPPVSKTWGLLATPKLRMNRDGISENIVDLKGGGLVLSDSRLQFSIVQGYTVMVGFTTKAELENWGKMELPYSDVLKAKVDELEVGGIHINCAWPTACPK
ncbi:hypothetical protein BGZ61DRAFT_375158 [Ilyonectria robusta]|uniref:uncharacterized protein n=1 Tax=Ilyonectria robusta TaxID=1079257 RepID=UPI001E8CD478|nr:uncharacterized protein BGZ61DRAFT_375158 [Ilyonectria robusta]KAH8651725.1 hypothetical protein BGZ61DRAFT_375158 [Ilyonectria robusta]